MEKKDPCDLYYYCPDCNKFHYIESNKAVDRKLCFYCNVTRSRNTKILHDGDTSTQICDQCIKEIELTEEELKEYSKKPTVQYRGYLRSH